MEKIHGRISRAVLLVAAFVMMLSTVMIASAAETSTPVKTFKVLEDGQAIKSYTLYANGTTEEESDNPVLTAEEWAEGFDAGNPTLNSYKKTVDLTVQTTVAAGAEEGKTKYTVSSNNQRVVSVKRLGNDNTKPDYRRIRLTAVGNGTAKITLKDLSNVAKPKTYTFTVTVNTLVDDITFGDNVSNNTLEIGVGGSLSLEAAVNSDATAGSAKLKYKVIEDGSNVISVDNKGVVKGKKEGTATVRIYAEDQTCKVGSKTYKGGTYEDISVEVSANSKLALKITGIPAAGVSLKTNKGFNTFTIGEDGNSAVESTDDSSQYMFKTSKPTVATVDRNGKITAVGNGTATITVIPADGTTASKLGRGETASVKVTVTTDPEKINVPSDEITVLVGKTVKVGATVDKTVTKTYQSLSYADVALEADGVSTLTKPKKDLDRGVINLNSKTGAIKGLKEGYTEVLIRGNGEKTGDITKRIGVHVVEPITALTAKVSSYPGAFEPGSPLDTFFRSNQTTLYMGTNAAWKNVSIDVIGKNRKGEIDSDELIGKLSYTSNKTAVATVDEKGNIQAKGPGTANITVTANDGSKKKATIKVVVVQPVQTINVANTAYVNGELRYYIPNTTAVGKTKAFTLSATANSNASSKTLTYEFNLNPELGKEYKDAFVSSNKNKLTVRGISGLEEAQKLGTYTIKPGVLTPVNYDLKADVDVYLLTGSTMPTQIWAESNGIYYSKEKDGYVGLTLYKGETRNLADLIKFADTNGEDWISDRALTWSTTFKSINLNKNTGVVKASKVGTDGEIRVKSKNSSAATTIPVRVVESQTDFVNALNAKVTAMVKAEDYSVWTGMKPSFNTKTGVIDVAVQDLALGKEEAQNAREAIEALLLGIQEGIIDETYKAVKATDTNSGESWSVEDRISYLAVIDSSGKEYNCGADRDAAIRKLAEVITEDAKSLADWAGRSLEIELTKKDEAFIGSSFVKFEDGVYSKTYTVNFNVNVASIETLIDGRIEKQVDYYNREKKNTAGINTLEYNDSTNSLTVNLYDPSVSINEVRAQLQSDAIASLKSTFREAVKAEIFLDGEKVGEVENQSRTEAELDAAIQKLISRLENNEEILKITTLNDLMSKVISVRTTFRFNKVEYIQSYTVKVNPEIVDIAQDALLETDRVIDAAIEAELPNINTANEALVEVTYGAKYNALTVTMKDESADVEDVVGIGTLLTKILASSDKAELAVITGVNSTEDRIDIAGKNDGEIKTAIRALFAGKKLGDFKDSTINIAVSYGELGRLSYTVEFMKAELTEEAFKEQLSKIEQEVDAQASAYTGSEKVKADYNKETKTFTVTINGKKDDYVETLKGNGLGSLLNSVLGVGDNYDVHATKATLSGKGITETTAEISKIKAEPENVLQSALPGVDTLEDLDGKSIMVAVAYEGGSHSDNLTYTINFVLNETVTITDIVETPAVETDPEDTEAEETETETTEPDEDAETKEPTEETETDVPDEDTETEENGTSVPTENTETEETGTNTPAENTETEENGTMDVVEDADTVEAA